MDYQTEPSIESSNRKLERIRKNILHDVLVYNLEASENKRRHRKEQEGREQIMFEVAAKNEREAQYREDEAKRLNLLERRRQLKQEYDRGMHEKKLREEREKREEEMYAQLEKEHQIYSN